MFPHDRPNGPMNCSKCGRYSSARVCWTCSNPPKDERVERVTQMMETDMQRCRQQIEAGHKHFMRLHDAIAIYHHMLTGDQSYEE